MDSAGGTVPLKGDKYARSAGVKGGGAARRLLCSHPHSPARALCASITSLHATCQMNHASGLSLPVLS
jgi:hypothetical protein